MTNDVEKLREEILAHYGIKGMKWGIRRTDKQLARRADKKWVKEMTSTESRRAIFREADKASGAELVKINKKYGDGKIDLTARKNKDLRTGYIKEVHTLYSKNIQAAADKRGLSPSESKKLYGLVDVETQTFAVIAGKVQQSEMTKYVLKPTFNSLGYITDLTTEEVSIEHEDLSLDEVLAHFGVKGMKWGIRRTDKQLAKAAIKRDKEEEKDKVKGSRRSESTRFKTKGKDLTDDELDQRIKRLEKEKRYNELNKRTVGKGQKATAEILSHIGKENAKKIGKDSAAYAARLAVTKKFNQEVADQVTPAKKKK